MAAQLPEKPTVGFIGLGVMGLPMLQNLSQEFSNLVVWNRTPKQPELPSSSANMQIASSPAEVIAASDITFSMLSTPAAVEAVFHETPALTALQPGKALVDCSTLQISDMQKTAGAVADRGATFLEAPVSGSKVPAELGQLIFLCAGDKPLFDDPVLQKAFSLMGKKAVFLGEVGNGTKMKVYFPPSLPLFLFLYFLSFLVFSIAYTYFFFILFDNFICNIACCEPTHVYDDGLVQREHCARRSFRSVRSRPY